MSLHRIDAPVHAPLAPLCRPDPRDTLLDRLCEVAHSVPDAIAIDSGEGTVTFDELLHRTYASARKIADLTSNDLRPIAVDAACTIDSITLMLAVMASGHSLVPLDTNLPENRSASIAKAASALRLTTSDLADAQISSLPLPAFTGGRTALIAFTSGSTGAAKGVLLSHRMCLTKAYEVSSALGLTTRDRVGNALPVSFGAGLNTLFAGLLSGASVYCTDPRSTQSTALTEWIEQSALTTLHCSPSLVRSFATGVEPISSVPDDAVPSLRVVTTYGEALHSKDVSAFRSALGSGASFVNWYATTEAGAVAFDVYSAGRPLPPGYLPAGKQPRGKTVEIVGPDGTPVTTGAIGEVRVSAPVLADGYLGLDDLTRSRFFSDRVQHHYRTGDLGRVDSDGVLHLAGRVDEAIKVRGYLVEPAEVEGFVRSLPGITDVFVTACIHDGNSELAAYFVGRSHTESEVRSALRENFPEWMVPMFVVELDSIPRNERGKVDRNALPSPLSRPTPHHAAVGATERWVASVVSTQIDTDRIGRDDDFSALGATSLSMVNILIAVNDMMHVQLTPSDLGSAMTVRTLAELIDRKLSESETVTKNHGSTVLVRLNKSGGHPALFVVTGAGVPALGMVPLARRMSGDRAVYALQPRGLDGTAIPDRTVRGAARRYIREIKSVQPEGPYIVAGHSIGGWTALEVARLLTEAGDVVEQVVLLDPLLLRDILDRLPGGPGLPHAAPLFVRPANIPIRDRIRYRIRLARAGLKRESTTERWLTFALVASKAMSRHRPKPWAGAATVVVSDDNVADPASWAAVVTGRLTLVHVKSSHNEFVREPAVVAVAEAVENAMGSPIR